MAVDPPSKNGTSILPSKHKSERVIDAVDRDSQRHFQDDSEVSCNCSEALVSLLTPLPESVNSEWHTRPAKVSTLRSVRIELSLLCSRHHINVSRSRHVVINVRRNNCDIESNRLAKSPGRDENVRRALAIMSRRALLNLRRKAGSTRKRLESVTHTVVATSDKAAMAAHKLMVSKVI